MLLCPHAATAIDTVQYHYTVLKPPTGSGAQRHTIEASNGKAYCIYTYCYIWHTHGVAFVQGHILLFCSLARIDACPGRWGEMRCMSMSCLVAPSVAKSASTCGAMQSNRNIVAK